MHPRNIYTTPPNFAELAEEVPVLKPFIKLNKQGGPTIDFHNPEALRTLTKALLQRDFKRDVYLPEDRLCPPVKDLLNLLPAWPFRKLTLVARVNKLQVAGRLDYILYIQDVIRHHRKIQAEYGSETTSNYSEFIGLDIGTGASAIYPMLFTAIDDHVRMVGSDINEESSEVARKNVEQNSLSNRIAILRVSPVNGFFDEVLIETTHLDFTMCNPPFYVSDEEMQRLTAEKELPPHATCTGAPNEMVTPGGEAAFVIRMIRESKQYAQQMSWYSSLIGRATSVISLVKELVAVGCNNYGLIESSPSHTHRWILMWSWSDVRLPDELARHLPPSSALTKSLPPPNELSYFCPVTLKLDIARSALSAFLDSLDIQAILAEEDGNISRWRIQASYAGWTRAARRGHARAQAEQSPNTQKPLLCCELSLDLPGAGDEKQVELKACWRRGTDRHAFESFFSTCVRKLAGAASNASSNMSTD